MMPNITRGGSTAGLMVYLFGAGKQNEHTDQRIVAGDVGAVREFLGAPVDTDYVLDVANYLDEPMRAFGVNVVAPVKRWNPESETHVVIGEKPAHMWHCSLSISADEGRLDDAQWSAIAQDFVREMGFASDDIDDAGCRWVAVRHGASAAGNDHVHIAVNLIREDGSRASVHNDFRRAQAAANKLEHKHGLRVLASREEERTVPSANKPAELDRVRGSERETDRDELRRRLRAAAVSATSERDFIERARQSRVLLRPRFGCGEPRTVVGYSAALTPTVGADGKRSTPVWFGGAKLERTLGLGQLRARWGSTPEEEADAVTAWTTRGRHARSGQSDVSTKNTPQRLPADVVQRLNAHGQNVVPKRGNGFDRYAAVDLSGAFAQASLYFERGVHGPMATASEVFARAAAPARYAGDRAAPRRQTAALGSSAAYTARLVARGTGRDSATGWIAVFRQMQRVARALEQQMRAAGQVTAATTMQRAVAGAVRAFEDATASAPRSPGTPTRTSRTVDSRGTRDGRER